MKRSKRITKLTIQSGRIGIRKVIPVSLIIAAFIMHILILITQHPQPSGFTDEFNQFEADRWQISGPWGNGVPFWNGWRSDHITFSDGALFIRLDDVPCSEDPSQCAGQPYASGEYQSLDVYQYGCLEGRFKAAQEDGVVTSLFIYSGELHNTSHDEIDIEILGNNPDQMQINYFTDGISHPKLIDLGFNAASDFHDYAIEWTETRINWYVDGELLHTEDGSNGDLPTHAGHIMMNLWPVDETASDWAGEFNYPGVPIYASYDWVKFSASTCK